MSKPKTGPEEFKKLLDKIKVWAIQAMFSDDELLEQLVLKGGNAMALVHQVSARASVDLDFSLRQDFGGDVAKVESRISRALSDTFRSNGFEVFDFKMIEKRELVKSELRVLLKKANELRCRGVLGQTPEAPLFSQDCSNLF